MSRGTDLPVMAQRQSGPTRASIRRAGDDGRDPVIVIEQLNLEICDYDLVTVIDAVNYYDTVRALRALEPYLMPALGEIRGEHIRKELCG